jgi:hypothetical protein
MNPAIFLLLEDLLPRYGINRVRFCREGLSSFALSDLPALCGRLNPAKWAILRWRSSQIKPHLATSDGFFGVLYSGLICKRVLCKLISNMRREISFEVCIHPGFSAPKNTHFYPRQSYNEFISSSTRQVEHDVLTDEKLACQIRARGLTLRGFDGQAKY